MDSNENEEYFVTYHNKVAVYNEVSQKYTRLNSTICSTKILLDTIE